MKNFLKAVLIIVALLYIVWCGVIFDYGRTISGIIACIAFGGMSLYTIMTLDMLGNRQWLISCLLAFCALYMFGIFIASLQMLVGIEKFLLTNTTTISLTGLAASTGGLIVVTYLLYITFRKGI